MNIGNPSEDKRRPVWKHSTPKKYFNSNGSYKKHQNALPTDILHLERKDRKEILIELRRLFDSRVTKSISIAIWNLMERESLTLDQAWAKWIEKSKWRVKSVDTVTN